jgi:hypothetical protein
MSFPGSKPFFAMTMNRPGIRKSLRWVTSCTRKVALLAMAQIVLALEWRRLCEDCAIDLLTRM